MRLDQTASPPPAPLTMFTVKCSQLSAKIMAQVGFSDLASSTVSVHDQFFLLQFAFVSTQLTKSGTQPSVLIQSGTAIRVGIRSTNVQGKVTANVVDLAASTTMGLVTSFTSVKYVGFDQAMQNQLPSFTYNAPFDATMLSNLGQLIATVQDLVVKNPSYIQPAPIEYQSQVTADSDDAVTTVQGVSAAYALHTIGTGMSLSAAISHLQSKVDAGATDYDYEGVNPFLVQAMYYQISGGEPDAPVSNATKSTAHKILSATNI